MPVRSLLLTTIGNMMPEEVLRFIAEQHQLGRDFETPIRLALRDYDYTLEQMVNFNLDYGGWWGLPGPVSVFTYNRF